MATDAAWQKGAAVLQMTYGKLASRQALGGLYRSLNDLDDEQLLEAISRHCDDDTPDGGRLIGEWFPKPARLRFHANAFKVIRDRQWRAALEVEEARFRAIAEAKPKKTVAFPGGGEYGLPASLEVSSAACKECADSGLSPYYIPKLLDHPRDKYRVFLASEFAKMPSELRPRFRRYSAVCDCKAGQMRRAKHPTQHVAEKIAGRDRRCYITIEEARQMAEKRFAKEGGQYGISEPEVATIRI